MRGKCATAGAEQQFHANGAAGGEAHATPPFGQARAGVGDLGELLELSRDECRKSAQCASKTTE